MPHAGITRIKRNLNLCQMTIPFRQRLRCFTTLPLLWQTIVKGMPPLAPRCYGAAWWLGIGSALMKQGPKRKILLYVPSLSGGGAERVSALLTNGFTAVGDEVIVAVDYLNANHPHDFDKNINIHVLGRAHGKAVLGLARLLHREKPDVAHSVLCLANLKLTLAAALNGQLSRVVLSYHGFFSSEPQ